MITFATPACDLAYPYPCFCVGCSSSVSAQNQGKRATFAFHFISDANAKEAKVHFISNVLIFSLCLEAPFAFHFVLIFSKTRIKTKAKVKGKRTRIKKMQQRPKGLQIRIHKMQQRPRGMRTFASPAFYLA